MTRLTELGRKLVKSLPLQLSSSTSLLVEFGDDSMSFPLNITSDEPSSDSLSGMNTRRVCLHPKITSCPRLAELYEQLVEFIFKGWEIALDSPSLF